MPPVARPTVFLEAALIIFITIPQVNGVICWSDATYNCTTTSGHCFKAVVVSAITEKVRRGCNDYCQTLDFYNDGQETHQYCCNNKDFCNGAVSPHATLYLAGKCMRPEKCLEWVEAQDGKVPNGAVEVGHFGGRGGETMYVGRVLVDKTDVVPGTIIPSQGGCFVALNGAEYKASDYEVLVNVSHDGCRIHWSPPIKNHPGMIPGEAVKAGYDAVNDEAIFVARGRPPGKIGTHAGQVRCGDSEAVISFEGEVFGTSDFKVLCCHYLHDHHHHHQNTRPRAYTY